MAKPKKRQEEATASVPWVIVVAKAFPTPGVGMPLAQLYARIEGHPRTKVNPHWKDKVRQVLQRYPCFERVEKGVWALKPGSPNGAPKSRR